MKNNRLFLGLVAAMVLISGCGKTGMQSNNISATAAETAAPANDSSSEHNSIDDSYTMEQIENTGDYSEYKELMAQAMIDCNLSRFMDNCQMQDMKISTWNNSFMYGWILFTGEPKQDLDWQTVEVDGQEMYCRSVFARCNDDVWQVSKSYAMQPYKNLSTYEKLLPETKLPEGCSNYHLNNLSSAQLYVQQLDKTFTITDEAALRQLEAALSLQQDIISAYSGSIDTADFLNPLYLYFNDGSQRLIYTAGDGTPCNSAWDNWGFNSVQSIFELFDVPLEAKGYTNNSDGTTTVTIDSSGLAGEDRPLQNIYSADNQLLAKLSEDSEVYYYYCADRPLDYIESYHDKQLSSTDSFEYNELRQLVRHTYAPVNGMEYYYEYAYDELGRITTALSYYDNGALRENAYFWYDEAGEQYQYHYENGEIIGDTPPSDEPIRRK